MISSINYSPAGQRLPDTLFPVNNPDSTVLSMSDGMMGDFLVAGTQALATPGQIAAAAEHINNVMAVLPEKTLIELLPGARDAIDSAIDQTPKGEPVKMPALRQMIRMRYSSILITLVAFMLTFLATTSDVAAQDEGDPLAGLTEGQKEWILEQMCNTAGPVGQLCADLVEQVRAAEDADSVEQVRAAEDADSATVTGYASASADDEATVVSSYPNGAGNDEDGEKPTLEPTPTGEPPALDFNQEPRVLDTGLTEYTTGYNEIFTIPGYVGKYVVTRIEQENGRGLIGLFRISAENELIEISDGSYIGAGVNFTVFVDPASVTTARAEVRINPVNDPQPVDGQEYQDLRELSGSFGSWTFLTQTVYQYGEMRVMFKLNPMQQLEIYVWSDGSWVTYNAYAAAQTSEEGLFQRLPYVTSDGEIRM